MSKFGNYEFQASKEPQKFIFIEDGGDPQAYVMVLPATQANKAYTNARQKDRRAIAEIMRGNVNVAENRKREQKLYAQHVVKGWGNIVDQDGEPVEFSQKECQEYLAAIPYWWFEDLQNFCNDPLNFGDGPAGGAVAQGKD